MSQDATLARQLALSALKQVLNHKNFLTDTELEGSAEDQARALSLARGILRYLSQLDTVLMDKLEKRPPSPVMHMLRIGAYEILVEERPSHAVVDQAVRLAKSSAKTAGFGGLVNAVLRKITFEDSRNAFLHSRPAQLPNAFIGQMKSVEPDAHAAIVDAHQRGAAIDLTLKNSELSDRFSKALDADVLPTGSLRLKNPAQVSKLDGFVDGDWWVQDAAAALPARVLQVQKGQRVLDMCAAPGGKTLQLASFGADVIALDISKSRMARVRSNLERCKLNANIVVEDAMKFEASPFDAILLDAPCSASGTIRRHPELPILKANMDLGDLLKLQKSMLKKASLLLKPGGALVYAVCSLFDAEGIAQAEWALKNLDLNAQNYNAEDFGISKEFQPKPNSIRLRPDYWPELGGMDGFFIAKFTKAG